MDILTARGIKKHYRSTAGLSFGSGAGSWGGPGIKVRFLRRLPRDPFNVTDEGFDDETGWELRSPNP